MGLTSPPWWSVAIICLAVFDSVRVATCFAPTAQLRSSVVNPSTNNFQRIAVTLQETNGQKYDPEEEVQRRLERARAVLAKSKAKLEMKERNSANGTKDTTSAPEVAAVLPFFATKKATINPNRREMVTKSKDDKTGLIQADGEKMAALSENEEWEFRSLFEVFENEMDENADVYSAASRQLAERDVVASIWNLRKQMKTEDYMKIFDKKNWFIGEDN